MRWAIILGVGVITLSLVAWGILIVWWLPLIVMATVALVGLVTGLLLSRAVGRHRQDPWDGPTP